MAITFGISRETLYKYLRPEIIISIFEKESNISESSIAL
ncbi:MAG: hypothetical protein H0U57_04560 [Tatlockia sp.]|nr:hypothetical protein [Tatlockia sp.]